MKTVRSFLSAAIYLLIFLAAGNAEPAAGQGRKYEGRRIATIQFVPYEQPLEPVELKEILPLKIGAPLGMADVRAAIERLYATGRYEDIQVDAQPLGEQVVIRFITRESYFIGHVSVNGDISEPPNAGQLANATRLDLGQPFSEEKVAAAQEGIKRLLDANGLYLSHIRTEYQYDPLAQQVHVTFVVESGSRAHFAPPELKGELKVPRDTLISATRWRRWIIGAWKPVTQQRVRRGIDGIRDVYEKQGRLEAKVALDSMAYDGDSNRVRPVVEIEAGPRIEVRTIGAKVSGKKLRQYIPIYEEHTVDRELLVEGARNLRDHFQSQGYFEAEVEPKEQRVINDTATIDYLVNTGRRHKLAHIAIEGNRYFSTETLRERMFLQTANLLQFRHGRFSGSLLRRDEDSIAALYRSNGFRDVSVTSRIVENYKGKADEIAVFVKVEEGPQWFVERLEIAGVESLEPEALRGMLSSAEGQPFSEYNVSVDRDTILSQYFSEGFPNAAFEWSSRPAAQPNRVNLRFAIREGERQVVRQVLITGLKMTDPQLVARNILLNPGDPLSPNRMTETQRRLYDLGVFAKVDTAIQNPDGETGRKYVQYDMEEASKYSVAMGFGAEIARIGGCQTCLDFAGRGGEFRAAHFFRRQPAEPVGPGAHHQPAHARVHARTARAAQLLLAAFPRRRPVQPLLHRALRQVAQRADVHLQAAGRVHADLAAVFEGHHVPLPLRLPAGERGRGNAEDFAAADPAVRAAGAAGNAFDEHDPGPARRSGGAAQGHLQHRRCGTRASAGRVAEQLLALSGPQRHLPPAHAAVDAGAQHQLRRAAPVRLYRRCFPGHPAAGAFLRRRRQFAPGISGSAGGAARPGHGLPARRHGAAVQPDGAALPADRGEYRRRTFSRRRQRLFERGQDFVAGVAAGREGLRLHGARGGLRLPLPDADRADARGPGVQHQSAAVFRVQGG